jgi:hypothetical protein
VAEREPLTDADTDVLAKAMLKSINECVAPITVSRKMIRQM